jgi:uncharacterized protein (DUF433 family)
LGFSYGRTIFKSPNNAKPCPLAANCFISTSKSLQKYLVPLSSNLLAMKYGEISIDPEVMSGAPVFAGTRVHIQTLFDYIEGGEDLAEFLDDFPSVSKEAAVAVLEMARKTLTTEKMLHENFA